MTRSSWQRVLPCALLPLTIACGSSIKTQGTNLTPDRAAAAVAPAPAPPPASLPEVAPVDPVLTLIAASDLHFRTGERDLEQGHFEAARDAFNQAVDELL